ncbi:uncharacterized protein ACMZJ9_013712 [Mantella aurantiaca]
MSYNVSSSNWMKLEKLTTNGQYGNIYLDKEMYRPKGDIWPSKAEVWHVYAKPANGLQNRYGVLTPAVTCQFTSAEQRLVETLQYLAIGCSYEDLKFTTDISTKALGRIPETCEEIINVIIPEYLKFPKTVEDCLTVSKDFEDVWQFSNCEGVLDGKHIRIRPPPNSGSTYVYNYKGFFSVLLMTLVNPRYELLMFDFRTNGRVSDGVVFDKTVLCQRLKSQKHLLPSNNCTVQGLNLVFVADKAFAIGEHMIKPYPAKNLNEQRKIFNYRLSRAQRVAENAFGILPQRFCILRKAISVHTSKIGVAFCVLHNYLRGNNAMHHGVFSPNCTHAHL